MIQEFFSKAKENLTAATLLFENGLYNASANRAYYAAFQATLAVLARVGIIGEERKSHKTTQSLFVYELIHRRKMYPSHLKSYLADLLTVREDADYELTQVSQRIAWRQLKKAKELVETLIQE
jgi:uncharacterized protein (UPF0332 family)